MSSTATCEKFCACRWTQRVYLQLVQRGSTPFANATLQALVFMVKNYSDNLHSIKNTEDLTMKQMFDISEKLISEQSDEIYGSEYNQLGRFFMEVSIFGW